MRPIRSLQSHSSTDVGVNSALLAIYVDSGGSSITSLRSPYKSNKIKADRDKMQCCGGFLGTRRAFPVVGLQVEKRGQGRVNPAETCLPAYSGELVLQKPSVLLGLRAFWR